MFDTTYLDSNAPPPESPLVLLGSDPKEELALYKDVPKYSDRLAVELSRLRKYSDFKGNPFLYNPNDYIESFRSLPIWMRNFSDKFVYPKSDSKDETLL